MFVTPGVGALQVVPGGTTLPMIVDPGGMMSLTMTFNARPGPKLVTRAVFVLIPLKGTLAGAFSVTPTSAWFGTTSVETLAALLAAFGSSELEVTVAVLTNVDGAG